MTSDLDDDDVTVHMSNVSGHTVTACPAVARHITFDIAGGCIQLPPQLSIADSGATQIFVMDGSPIVNR